MSESSSQNSTDFSSKTNFFYLIGPQGQAGDVARALLRGARQGDGGQVQGGASGQTLGFDDLIFKVQICYPGAVPILPDLQLSKQNRADTGNSEIKGS